MKQKLLKGEYGFYKSQQKKSLLLTILFFAIVLAVFFTGLIATGNRLNVMTVVAVLGCLPACKQTVNLFMLYQKKPCSMERYNAIRTFEKSARIAYELYITSQKGAYPFDAVCVKNHTILFLTHPGKMDTSEFQLFLREILKNNEIKNCTIKVYEKENSFLEHVKSLVALETESNEEMELTDTIMRVLLAISL